MPKPKQFDIEETLDKAIDIFWSKGYRGTSIRDLVEGLGINRASIYDTYGNKNALFLSALDRYHEKYINAFRDELLKYNNVQEGIKRTFTKIIDKGLVNEIPRGCMVVNTASELCSTEINKNFFVEKNATKFEKIMYDYLLNGQKNGQINSSTDIESLANTLYTFYSGLQTKTKHRQNIESLKKEITAITALIC